MVLLATGDVLALVQKQSSGAEPLETEGGLSQVTTLLLFCAQLAQSTVTPPRLQGD